LQAASVALTLQHMLKAKTDAELLRELKHIAAYLKHGPNGRGERGPCDPDCAKCGVEADIKELEAKISQSA
jgi:hypothetical protein